MEPIVHESVHDFILWVNAHPNCWRVSYLYTDTDDLPVVNIVMEHEGVQSAHRYTLKCRNPIRSKMDIVFDKPAVVETK